jgi:predicted nucleic acid-binding protein
MRTRTGERLLDTNILLAATASARPFHVQAMAVLDQGFADRSLVVSGQVVREYLAVATRPAENNGLGLTTAQALGNVSQFLDRAECLEEDRRVTQRFLALLVEVPSQGNQVHDAHIVATMLAHGVGHLLTLNPKDFQRFAGLIHVTGP